MIEHGEIKEKCRLVANDYQQSFDKDLVSVILYGSAITQEYSPKKSDLNFLIVLSEDGIEKLNLAHELVAKWRKKRVGTPLFITKAYIESSLDTFPIEFLNIKQNYIIVFGEDVLEGLNFDKNFLRIQCERELKGKLLLLRERYVETKGKARALKSLVSGTVLTFVFISKGLLYLMDKKIPTTKQEAISVLARELNLDEELFLTLLKIRGGTLKPSSIEIQEIFKKYLREIRALALLMDTMDFGISPGKAC